MISFTVKNSSGGIQNLTGANATLRIGKNFVDAVEITKVGSIPAPLTGIVTFSLEEADTEDLDPMNYVYEMVVELSGSTTVAAQGTIYILNALL